MDAIKFMQEYHRMCSSCERCADCPLYTDRPCAEMPSRYNNVFSSKLIKAVEDWSAAHPINTRADALQKICPGVPIDTSGVVDVCPTFVDKNFVCGFYKNCTECRKYYWLSEVLK